MKRVCGLLLILSFAAPLMAAPRDRVLPAQGSTPETAQVDPSTYGPYGIGVTTVTWYDKSRGDRPITTEIWYPASVPEGEEGEYYYHLGYGIASRDAVPVEGETYPLIVFSHGAGAMRFQSIFYCEQLASQGYVVVAPDHYGNTFYSYDAQLTLNSPIDRPLDVTYVIDSVLDLSASRTFPVPGTVDKTRIGMTGHSFGAYTTLVISGALIDINAAEAGCAQGDSTACGAVAYAEQLYGPLDFRWLDLSDPRVSVGIPQAPGIYSYFGEEGLANVFTDTCEMAAGNDGILAWEEEAWPIYQALPSDKILLTLEGRGHYVYSSAWDIHPFERTCDNIEDCPDRDPSHVIVNTLATAFFGYYLKDEDVWAPWLQESYYEQEWPVRLSYEREGGP